MKNQYFGDVNDFLKYGILRSLLEPTSLSLHVAWMLTPNDDGPDGAKTRYLKEPERWRSLDPPLFDAISQALAADESRGVVTLEKSRLLPDATFHSSLLADQLGHRLDYFAALKRVASPPGLLFFDPDNGLEVKSVPKGRKNSSKYLYWDEVESAWSCGHSLLIYQHFPRRPRTEFLESVARELRTRMAAGWVGSFQTSHVAFLLTPQTGHRDQLLAGTRNVIEKWAGRVKAVLHT